MKKVIFAALALTTMTYSSAATIDRVALSIDPATFKLCAQLDYILAETGLSEVSQVSQMGVNADTPFPLNSPEQMAALTLEQGRAAVLGINCYDAQGHHIGSAVKMITSGDSDGKKYTDIDVYLTPHSPANNWDTYQGFVVGVITKETF